MKRGVKATQNGWKREPQKSGLMHFDIAAYHVPLSMGINILLTTY